MSEALLTVWHLQYQGDTDELLRKLAAELRKDEPDRHALKLLALAIDPDKGGIGGTKLVVKRPGRGTPALPPNQWPGHLMWAHFVVLNHKQESAVAEAKRVFGIARSTALAALAETKASAQRYPDVYEVHAETVRRLWAAGELDRLWQSD